MWEDLKTPAAFQHGYRQPSHSELSPQAFTGLFQRFKYFQESKATRTTQTRMPTPWPPPVLSRYNRHPPTYLHSEPVAFPFCPGGLKQAFSLPKLTGLPAVSFFWGKFTYVVRVLGLAGYHPPKGDLAVTFS